MGKDLNVVFIKEENIEKESGEREGERKWGFRKEDREKGWIGLMGTVLYSNRVGCLKRKAADCREMDREREGGGVSL